MSLGAVCGNPGEESDSCSLGGYLLSLAPMMGTAEVDHLATMGRLFLETERLELVMGPFA